MNKHIVDEIHDELRRFGITRPDFAIEGALTSTADHIGSLYGVTVSALSAYDNPQVWDEFLYGRDGVYDLLEVEPADGDRDRLYDRLGGESW
mgnify:CR=1 FL=1